MKKTIVICDRCKKEIKGDYLNLVAGYFGSEKTMNMDHEYCAGCINDIFAFANETVEKTSESKAEEKPAHPVLRERDAGKSLERNAETSKSIIPVTKGMSNAEKIKHLYNQGCSNKHIANTVGTTANAVAVTICQLRKKGEIK